ncbi:MAG: glycosyltransferase [Pedococcus sp.]
MTAEDLFPGDERDVGSFATAHPKVSYVIPVLNDADALGSAIEAVLGQDYPGEQEVVIAVAPSHDGSREIAEDRARSDRRVVVVDNPDVHIPAGLNRAVAVATGEVVVRVDAHSELPGGYTRRMVEVLATTGAVNVGGLMHARGRTPLQSSVSRAYNSGLGLGGGSYHSGDEAGPGESAYLGVFRRSFVDRLGWYDTTIRRGEDYELNQRILAAGGVIWFVPDVLVTYWPRERWVDLARQMYATGVWRGELVRRRTPMSYRYAAAPALVVGLTASAGVLAARAVGGPLLPWSVVHLVPVAYAGFLAYAGATLGGQGAGGRTRDAGVVATIHLTWGAGFLKGLAMGAGGTVDRSRVIDGEEHPLPPTGPRSVAKRLRRRAG